MREYWRIYRALAGAYIRSRMQYRLSFWLGVVVLIGGDVMPLLLVGAMLARFRVIQGWHWSEIAVLYGLGQLAFGLMRCFATQVDHFDEYVVSGQFDSFLIRPLPPLFHLMAAQFEALHLGRLACGVGVFLVATRAAKVALTPANIAVAVGAAVGGAMILFSLTLMIATCSFWQTRTGKLQDFVQGAGREFANYPLSIYPTGVRFLLTCAFPLALITYYPAQRLLGRGESGALLPLLSVAALPMGVVFLAIAMAVWRVGLRHYQSTGS